LKGNRRAALLAAEGCFSAIIYSPNSGNKLEEKKHPY